MLKSLLIACFVSLGAVIIVGFVHLVAALTGSDNIIVRRIGLVVGVVIGFLLVWGYVYILVNASILEGYLESICLFIRRINV